MSKNLPAYRYELFVKVFEKRVSAVQKEIEQLRGMEQVYNLLKDAMESLRLPNEQDIVVSTYYIFVKIVATPMDRLAGFDTAVKAIGRRLLDAKLHHDGEPAVRMGGDWCDVDYIWNCRNGRGVWLTIRVPDCGLPDLEVTELERVTQERRYVLRPIDPPAYAVPPNLQTAAGREAALAIDEKIVF